MYIHSLGFKVFGGFAAFTWASKGLQGSKYILCSYTDRKGFLKGSITSSLLAFKG